jgi:hypothetical protein
VYLETGNATEAYRQAYKPINIEGNANCVKAQHVLVNPKIIARIAELKAPAIAAAQITYEGHVAKLQQLRELAEASGNYPAAIRAEELRGKVAGLYVDRVETHVTADIRKIEIQLVKSLPKQH